MRARGVRGVMGGPARPCVSQRKQLEALVGPSVFGSRWVRRLARISFLGTLDRHPDSRSATSRLDHSLGVAALGLEVANALDLRTQARRELVTACLLHDVGHFPLSHSAEAGFEVAIGVGHHALSEWIIRGNGRIDVARSLRPAILAGGLDPERIWALITNDARAADLELASLLSVAINLDTLDGIVRAAKSFNLRAVKIPKLIFARREGALHIVPEALAAMDRFWLLKEKVYEEVINRPSNILYEAALSEEVSKAATPALLDEVETYDDEALTAGVATAPPTDDEFRERDLAYRFVSAPAPGYVLARTRKRYWVDRRVVPGPHGLALASLGRRYRQAKQEAFLVSDAPREQLSLLSPLFASPREPDL
jgi:HD domain